VKTGNSSSKEAALWGLGAPVVTLGFAAPVTPFLLMATGEESIIPKSTPIRASLTSDVALTRERVDAAQPGPLAEGSKSQPEPRSHSLPRKGSVPTKSQPGIACR
jgi:hypothetical protein